MRFLPGGAKSAYSNGSRCLVIEVYLGERSEHLFIILTTAADSIFYLIIHQQFAVIPFNRKKTEA